MCSGLAHGDTGATFGILDKRLVQRVQPGVNVMEISADVRIMYIATLVAYLLTEQAFELFEARSRAPY
jgi:hypothetical protein